MPSSAASATNPPTIATSPVRARASRCSTSYALGSTDTIEKIPPSTPLGKAMGYLRNQWEGLVRFCDDGRYGIDTNPVYADNRFMPTVRPKPLTDRVAPVGLSA